MIGQSIIIEPKSVYHVNGKIVDVRVRSTYNWCAVETLKTSDRFRGRKGIILKEFVFPNFDMWHVLVELDDGCEIVVNNVELKNIN